MGEGDREAVERAYCLMPIAYCLNPFFPATGIFCEKRTTIMASPGGAGRKKELLFMLDRISLVLSILGGINWLLVGLFRFDLVAYLFGGQAATVSRIIYTVVGIAALWCISLLFRERVSEPDGEMR